MIDVYPPLEESSITLLALSVLTFTLAYIAVEIMKALHFERRNYQEKFLKNILELIDTVEFSGKQRDFLTSEVASVPAPKEKEVKIKNELSLIYFAKFILNHIDNAWDSSVRKTAQTINFGVVRPVKWSRMQARTVYEKTTLRVGSSLTKYIYREKGLENMISFTLHKNVIDVVQFGLVQPLNWGLEKAHIILYSVKERSSNSLIMTYTFSKSLENDVDQTIMKEVETRASILLLLSSFMLFTIIYLVVELVNGMYRGESDYAFIMYRRYRKILFGLDGNMIKANNAHDSTLKKTTLDEKTIAKKKLQYHLPPFSEYLLTKVDFVWDFSVDKTAKVINYGWKPIKRRTIKVSDAAFSLFPESIQKMLS